MAPTNLLGDFSSALKDEFVFDDDDRRLSDDLLTFDDEVASQPGVDIFISSEDFMQMSDQNQLRRQNIK